MNDAPQASKQDADEPGGGVDASIVALSPKQLEGRAAERGPSALQQSRTRTFAAMRAALLSAAMLAACVIAPATAVVFIPLLPLPFALLALRFGARPVVSMTVGLTAAGLLAGAQAGLAGAAGLALVLGGSTGGLALVVAACGMGRKFQRAPLVAVTVAYLVLWGAIAAIGIGAAGLGEVRSEAERQVRSTYRPVIEECGDSTSDRCVELARQRDLMVDAAHDHTLLVLLPTLALGAFATAATTLLLARFFGTRAGLPIHRRRPLAEFEATWPVAYLLAAGLIAIMVGLEYGTVDSALVIAGVVASVLGGSVLLVQGMALTSFLLDRWKVRAGSRIAIWVLLLLLAASGLGLGWLIGIGALEMLLGVRRRAARADGGE